MKIPHSVRFIYDEQHEVYTKLKGYVDRTISSFKDSRWHYESRLKSPESFALKLETGRFEKGNGLEDFFGCMLVVENKSALKRAENLIKSNFIFKNRRPPSDKETHKRPDSFPFDDLRMYVQWKDDPRTPPTGLNEFLFEVQIKTFLQHAWSIATHDLIYKSDSVSWAKERIAYQIKAMLEHAEVSILEAEKLAESEALDKSNKYTKEVLNIILLIKDFWLPEQLPKNLVLLANNISLLISSLKIDLERLRAILDIETREGKGSKTLNLSPYGIVVQSLLNREREQVLRVLSSDLENFKIFIPQEIEIPEDVDKNLLKKAIFV